MVKKVQKKIKKGNRAIQTRPPLARMMRLHEALRSGGFPNCRQLAQELEVSSKTIQRDIDFMRDQLGLPIEYDARQFGFYYTEEVREFPNVQVSEGELVALFVAQKALSQYHGTSFEKPLTAAFRKLTEGLKDEVSVALQDWDKVVSFKALGPSLTSVRQFEQLSSAIRKRKVIRFQYRKLNARAYEQRSCQPYHLTCVDQQWYLFGHDLNRENIRTFVLARMKEIEVTSDEFQKPRAFSARKYLAKSFGIFSGDQEHLVQLDFDAFASQLIRERQWHATQKLEEKPDGCVRLEMRLGSLPEIARWVLSWGEHAKVVSPPELKDSVAASVRAMAAQYHPES